MYLRLSKWVDLLLGERLLIKNFSAFATISSVSSLGTNAWINSPLPSTDVLLTPYFYMILNQHEISNKMVYNMHTFWKSYFLVRRAYGSKWLPSLIQYDKQMATDQDMPPTFLWSPDDIFTEFEVKPNPF